MVILVEGDGRKTPNGPKHIRLGEIGQDINEDMQHQGTAVFSCCCNCSVLFTGTGSYYIYPVSNLKQTGAEDEYRKDEGDALC